MTSNGFLELIDSVDSTNNYAMQKVHAGLAKHGLACFAKEQTQGKGQRGKSWLGQPGQNIAMSLVLQPSFLKTNQQFYLSMATALACYDFFKCIADEEIKIKWPNDLYWRDRKAGGILIENVLQGNDWKWAIVGIGININQTEFDASLPNPGSLKKIKNSNYDVIALAEKLYHFVMKRFEKLATNNLEALQQEYNQHLYKLNQAVKLRKDNIVFETTVKEVSGNGQLKTKDVIERAFNFGDVEWIL